MATNSPKGTVAERLQAALSVKDSTLVRLYDGDEDSSFITVGFKPMSLTTGNNYARIQGNTPEELCIKRLTAIRSLIEDSQNVFPYTPDDLCNNLNGGAVSQLMMWFQGTPLGKDSDENPRILNFSPDYTYSVYLMDELLWVKPPSYLEKFKFFVDSDGGNFDTGDLVDLAIAHCYTDEACTNPAFYPDQKYMIMNWSSTVVRPVFLKVLLGPDADE